MSLKWYSCMPETRLSPHLLYYALITQSGDPPIQLPVIIISCLQLRIYIPTWHLTKWTDQVERLFFSISLSFSAITPLTSCRHIREYYKDDMTKIFIIKD
jgi:hypothetical protein